MPALHGGNVAGVRHDADCGRVAAVRRANRAQSARREVLALRTERDSLFGVDHGGGERVNVLDGQSEHVER